MLKIRMHKAGNGDCISIITESAFILVDGGTAQSFADWKEQIIGQTEKITKLIITHIDNDHVNGILKLLEHQLCPQIESVLFNGAEQLIGKLDGNPIPNDKMDRKLQALANEFLVPESNVQIGYAEGTSLSYMLNTKKLKCNAIVEGEALYREKLGNFNVGAIQFTTVGPEKSSLTEIAENWNTKLSERRIKPKVISKACFDAFELYVGSIRDLEPNRQISKNIIRTIESLASEPFEADTSATNRSSFAFLIEHQQKRFLYLGDCHAATVISWLDFYNIPKIKIDAVKISHHGSKNNTSMELLQRIDCSIYMISTNGKSHGHPNLETLARIAEANKEKNTRILMNYKLNNIPEWFIKEIQTKYSKITLEMDAYEVEL